MIRRCHSWSKKVWWCDQLQHFPVGPVVRSALSRGPGRNIVSGHQSTGQTSPQRKRTVFGSVFNVRLNVTRPNPIEMLRDLGQDLTSFFSYEKMNCLSCVQIMWDVPMEKRRSCVAKGKTEVRAVCSHSLVHLSLLYSPSSIHTQLFNYWCYKNTLFLV